MLVLARKGDTGMETVSGTHFASGGEQFLCRAVFVFLLTGGKLRQEGSIPWRIQLEKAKVLVHEEPCSNDFIVLLAPSDCLQSQKSCWLPAGRETSQDSSEKRVFGAPGKGYLIRLP